MLKCTKSIFATLHNISDDKYINYDNMYTMYTHLFIIKYFTMLSWSFSFIRLLAFTNPLCSLYAKHTKHNGRPRLDCSHSHQHLQHLGCNLGHLQIAFISIFFIFNRIISDLFADSPVIPTPGCKVSTVVCDYIVLSRLLARDSRHSPADH